MFGNVGTIFLGMQSVGVVHPSSTIVFTNINWCEVWIVGVLANFMIGTFSDTRLAMCLGLTWLFSFTTLGQCCTHGSSSNGDDSIS